MFKLEFDTDSVAFEGDQLHTETARILRQVADLVEECGDVSAIKDRNGNTIGGFQFHTPARVKCLECGNAVDGSSRNCPECGASMWQWDVGKKGK